MAEIPVRLIITKYLRETGWKISTSSSLWIFECIKHPYFNKVYLHEDHLKIVIYKEWQRDPEKEILVSYSDPKLFDIVDEYSNDSNVGSSQVS